MSFANTKNEIENFISKINSNELKKNPEAKNKVSFLKKLLGVPSEIPMAHEQKQYSERRILSRYLNNTFI